MAVNCLVIRNGIPVPVNREQFLHMDEGLSIEIGSNNVYRGKGKVYLTNFRLIFLKRDPSRQFSSFSLPYIYIIKHKYNKKLLGGPVITGTVKSVVNGGLTNNTKWTITFSDTNTAKSFYNLFEKELNKLASESHDNLNRYKRVCTTPTLSAQQIFPDQWAQYQRNQRLKQQKQNKNLILTNKRNKNQKQIIVGQSPDDAPMQLTNDYRAQKAKLFSSNKNKQNIAKGPITGASPVNVNTFTQHRVGKTRIHDATSNIPNNHNINGNKKDDYAAPAAAADYNAYIDPANPDDIVLSVPINDNNFNGSDEGALDEGKSNDNYMYDIGQKYDKKHNPNGHDNSKKNNNKKQKNIVAVSVGIDDNENDDHFNERPKVKPAPIGGNNNNNNNNNKLKQQPLDLNELFSQNSISVMENDSSQSHNNNDNKNKKIIDNPWGDSNNSNHALLNNNNNNNNNNTSEWQQF